MVLKPKDVRVPLPVQLILDCHWLVCVRGEGLTDRSIGHWSKHKIGFLDMQIHSLPRVGALRAAAEIKRFPRFYLSFYHCIILILYRSIVLSFFQSLYHCIYHSVILSVLFLYHSIYRCIIFSFYLSFCHSMVVSFYLSFYVIRLL